MKVSDIQATDLFSVIEPNGTLVVAEALRHVPFPIVRIFAVTAVEAGKQRGHHAHRALTQLLICVSGRIEVTVDDGQDRKVIVLDHLAQALLVPPGIWAEQTYGDSDTVLLVLCDQPYDESDYIRDYDEFLAYRRALRD